MRATRARTGIALTSILALIVSNELRTREELSALKVTLARASENPAGPAVATSPGMDERIGLLKRMIASPAPVAQASVYAIGKYGIVKRGRMHSSSAGSTLAGATGRETEGGAVQAGRVVGGAGRSAREAP